MVLVLFKNVSAKLLLLIFRVKNRNENYGIVLNIRYFLYYYRDVFYIHNTGWSKEDFKGYKLI